MGSLSNSLSQSKQNTVILPELEAVGTFASPDSVASSPGSNAVKVEGAWNNVSQSFTGDIGFTGDEVVTLINDIRLRDNEFVNSITSEMGDTVSDFADKIAAAQAGETGQFEKLFKNFLIAIVVIVGAVFFIKGKK